MTDAHEAPAAATGVAVAIADDTVIAVARRYAEALIDAAQKEGQVDSALGELAEFESDVLARFPRFADLLASERVPAADKDRILTEAFGGRASDLVLRFLRVLNRHGRLGLLGPIVAEARVIWDRRNRRIPVSVRTAVPLGEDQVQALRERLAGLVPGTPILSLSTDASLIGGLVVQVGDQMYDASVNSRLAQLRHRLIEGKLHEIQSRRDQFSYPA
jgi:F-type H+-transporting ATPase subunit delta